MTTTQHAAGGSTLPMILDAVEVVRVDRLSPSFVRVELAGACLADFGVAGPTYDQRIKLVFPGVPGGPAPSFEGADESWWDTWMSRPEEERGHMRTYTVRDVLGTGVDTRLVVDIVVHPPEHGEMGPGCDWAARAQVGDRVAVIAPRRDHDFGGIEFRPGTARRLLLVGDETAVPAACAILGQLSPDAIGAAFLEVPTAADIQTVPHPEGVKVVWLPREGANHGELLHPAVLAHLGVGTTAVPEVDEVDPDLWETPTYSSSGEEIDVTSSPGSSGADGGVDGGAVGGSGVGGAGVGGPGVGGPGVGGPDDLADLYAWIAGESGVVTGLRRALVKDLGVDRRQVAFMGYWRRGVAMRS